MTMNRVQFQPGLSIAEFVDQFGSEYKCEAALIASRWPGGFFLLGVWLRAQQLVSPPGTAVLPVHGVLASVQRDQRHDLRGDQTAAVVLVPGHAPAHAIEEQCRCARTQAPSGCLLQNSLVHEAQAHGCHARARTRVNATGAWRSTTPISAARSGGKVGARLGEQGTVRRRDADHARRSAPVGVLAPATLHPLGGGGVRRTLDCPVRVRCLRRPVVLWRGAADRR